MRLILASSSPRRIDLLSLLNVPFTAADPEFAETVRSDRVPMAQASAFALGKAESCRQRFPDSVILGCDTLIEIDGEVLGKPVDRRDAERMLRLLSGRDHLIHTAAALLQTANDRVESAVETVRVRFSTLGDAEVSAYLDTGESLGKAGAYAIQGRGAQLIECIDGDYTTAVGLPLRRVAVMLTRAGLVLPVDVESLYRANPYPNWKRFACAAREGRRLH
jgi:nucleoside triphosphate pyrophosphatase